MDGSYLPLVGSISNSSRDNNGSEDKIEYSTTPPNPVSSSVATILTPSTVLSEVSSDKASE